MPLRCFTILAALLFLSVAPFMAHASAPIAVAFHAIDVHNSEASADPVDAITTFSAEGKTLVRLKGPYAELFSHNTAYIQFPNLLQRSLGSALLSQGAPQPLLCNSLAMDARCFDCPECAAHRSVLEAIASKQSKASTPTLRYQFVASVKEMAPEGTPDAEGFYHTLRMTFTNPEAGLSLTLLREKRFKGSDFPSSPFLSKLNLFTAENDTKIYACPSPSFGGDCLLCSDCQAKIEQLKPFAK